MNNTPIKGACTYEPHLTLFKLTIICMAAW